MADPLSIAAIGWGVSAAGWLVSPCISKLLDRAYAYIKPGKSREKIRFLVTHTVPKLKLILEAAEGREHKHLFEGLLAHIKSAFYDTENILDEVEYIRRDQGVGTLSSLNIPGPLSKLLNENVKKIEELIKEAHTTIESANLQSNKGGDEHIPNFTPNNTKIPSISDPIGEVAGREKALEEIAEMLRQEDDRNFLSVIGIIGIAGSGKTTLAQCVCRSERTKRYFGLVMWIHVTKNFDVYSIYSEMFEQAWMKYGEKNRCPKYSSLDVLKIELEKLLTGKLFLLVLDDIWFNKEETTREEKLQLLLSPLKVGKEGSKILVTSRLDSLSRLGPDVTTSKYQIPDLDDEVFLKLFMHYALNNRTVKKEDQGKFSRIGAQIAKKLKKSPLLARVVGGILFQKPTVEVRDWLSVRDQNLLDKYMGALWWSYQHLGEQVRRCFAYCSIFPRRHVLRHDELVNLWVAEGFINTTNGGQEMEDVGRGYFNELLSASFLLPGGMDRQGKEYFFIHDLLYDLAVKVAGSDCYKIENDLTEQVPPDVRHLYIQSCDASMILQHIVKLKNLRTLMIYNGGNDINGYVFEKIFCKLRKLRVLIFRVYTNDSKCSSLSLPESIGCLKHLRYLGFHIWGIPQVTIPGTLGKLYLLQVLILDLDTNIPFSFGEDMIKLVDLRHVTHEYVSFPNIGRLTSLQTMPALKFGQGQGHELYQLKHLNKLQGKLEIQGLEYVQSKGEALEANLADKEQLTTVVLSFGFSEGAFSPDVQADVLEGLRPPDYIKCLRIYGYKGSRYPSWMVGTEKSTMYLEELELMNCSQPILGPNNFFITVSSLEMRACSWDTLPSDMEDLMSLELWVCDPLPSNLEQLTSLKSLFIRDCKNIQTLPRLPGSLDFIEITSCNVKGRENLEKIKYIPHKEIDYSSFDDIDDEEFEDPVARALTRRKRAEQLATAQMWRGAVVAGITSTGLQLFSIIPNDAE